MILSMVSILLSTMIGFFTAFGGMGARAEAPGVLAWDQAYYEANYTSLPLLPRFTVEFDEPLLEAFEGLKEESGFDVTGVVNSFPDIFALHRWMVNLFPGLIYDLRDNWMLKGDSYEGEGGDGARMVLYRLLGASVAMPVKARFVAVNDREDPDDYLINLRLTYADGSEKEFTTYSRYNAVTGDFGEFNGVGGLGYNMAFKSEYGPYAYTTDDSWQRGLGYMKLYDDLLLQGTNMANLVTVRLKFPYAGKDWMLQLWKGRYFVTTGGEVGLYNKPPSRLIEFYDCAADEERVGMSFKVTAHDKGEDITLIDIPGRIHWWVTGFAVQKYLYTADKLTLETEIVPIDEAMKQALIGALDREAANNVLSYTETAQGGLLITW